MRESERERQNIRSNISQFMNPTITINVKKCRDGRTVEIETREIERTEGRYVTDRRTTGIGRSVDTLTDPLEYARVLAETRPQELARRRALDEPVDVVDLGAVEAHESTKVEPMLKVVAHVVAAEWQHGERITTKCSNRAFGSGSLLRANHSGQEHLHE